AGPCQQFAALALMDQVISQPRAWPTGLTNHPEDHRLVELFKYLLQHQLVEISPEGFYQATARGRKAHGLMLRQQQSYLFNFNIYAAVDLAEGTFANPDSEDLDDPRWSDLRVAIAEFKGIDPYRLVFMAMTAGGAFFENTRWRRDLAPGSPFFKELEEIVQTQLTVPDLAFETEEGEPVPGEAVIEDVILQGADLNLERLLTLLQPESEAAEDRTVFSVGEHSAEGEDHEDSAGSASEPEEAGDTGWIPYEPEAPMARYREDPAYVEALWREPSW
ncbi:MAG: hypothetical protein OEW39_16535, partial [Deltaproteobacteria bacterium]|nr:hypothetical protein [Deltaproteobacteria bacterium]